MLLLVTMMVTLPFKFVSLSMPVAMKADKIGMIMSSAVAGEERALGDGRRGHADSDLERPRPGPGFVTRPVLKDSESTRSSTLLDRDDDEALKSQ